MRLIFLDVAPAPFYLLYIGIGLVALAIAAALVVLAVLLIRRAKRNKK